MAANTRSRGERKHNGNKISNVGKKQNEGLWNVFYITTLIVLALFISSSHRSYVANLFENDRHFSHLSTLERELAFRTEMGLYFSYFKTMIMADSTFDGLHSIMQDNITEYPSTINTLKRFNLYPEVVLGCAYRIYDYVNTFLGRPTKTCWTVNRGQGLSPISSCEGLGEPSYFYVEAVFLLNGLMMGVFFLFGTYLSGTMFGGFITVACLAFNHGECTRVQWTPPLRESFGYPLFVVQMFLVTIVIRRKISSYKYSAALACAQIFFMLSWQFAQFALLTQTLAVLGTYVFGYIRPLTFKVILLGQTIGLFSSFLLLFGNEMLLTSFFACCLVAAWVVVLLKPLFESLPFRIIRLLCQGVVFIVITLLVKYSIGKLLRLEDDAHIGEIFRSKFTDFQNFHTMMYTCAKEFDFIETQTLWLLMSTLLIPSAAVAMIALAFHLIKAELFGSSATNESDSGKGKNVQYIQDHTKPYAELVYHTFQLLAFTAMAVLVMRLKLFWTPHLCLYTSLLASRQLFPYRRKEIQFAVLAALVAAMAWYGIENIQKQRSIIGEFSNPPQEELIEWINNETPKNAVFAGPMPTMATVKLCTLRPIVNHPHYEDAGLRARTKLVYSMYSRKPLKEVKANLESLGVEYVIMEHSWCNRRSRPGCSLPEIWDIEDEKNRRKQAACNILASKPDPHFKLVFKNDVYHVLKLVKL